MLTRALSSCFVFGTLALSADLGAQDWPGEAGKSDTVKSWPGRDFESARNAGMPLCVYFFDPETKSNPRAKLIEGKGALGNAELRTQLPKFLCLKIKTDGTDYAGWPAVLRKAADKGATLVLMSSDLRSVISYDKNFQSHQITPLVVMTGMAKILEYETQQNALNPGRGVKKAEAVAQKTEAPKAPSMKVPGLTTTEAAPKPVRRRVPNPADE